MNASHLIERNTRAHTVDGYTAFHMVAAAHEATIRALVAELNTLKGTDQRPAKGSNFARLTFGAITVLVEYDSKRAEPETQYYIGCDASVEILSVFLNGVWCDAADVVPDDVKDRWEVQLLEENAESEARAKDDAAEDRAEMRRDWASEDAA